MFSVELVRDETRLPGLAAEWQSLFDDISPRLPFMSPLWCLTWWRHFRRDSLAARDTLHLYVLRDQTGQLAAIAPMVMTERPGRGPIRSRELQFFGADAYVTEVRGPICRPEDSSRVMHALTEHIRQHAPCDWVQWRGLAEHEAAGGRDHAFEPYPELTTTNYFLRLPDSWQSLRGGLTRNVRESLRKCYNSLKRDGHTFEFRALGSVSAVPAALDVFFDLHAMRARLTSGVQHRDVFKGRRDRDFLRDYCTALAQRSELHVFQIVIAGKVVATRIGFTMGDELYLYFSGYDTAWGKYSVMTTALAEAIKWSIERECRIVHLSTGTDVSKTRWRPEHTTYHGGYTIAGTAASALAFKMMARFRRSSLFQAS